MRQDSPDSLVPIVHTDPSPAESAAASPGETPPTSQVLIALDTISRQIGTNLVNADVLQTIFRTLTAALSLDYIAVLRFDAMASQASIIAEHPVRLGQTTTLPLEHFGIYQQLQIHSNAVVIDDLQNAADMLGPNQSRFQALNLHAMVVTPLLVQGDLIGGLLLGTGDRRRTITPNDLQVAQTVATQIALSLRTAEFFTEIQRRANQLERIAAFGRLVTGTLDQGQILRHVVEVVPNLIPADQVGVAFYTLDQNRMRLFESTDGITPQETSLTAAGSSVEEVVQHHNPILIVDLATSTYTDHQRLTQKGMQAAIIAPLMVSGRMLGAVMVAHKRVRIYTPTDLTLLQQIGNQIAIALENATIFNTARQRATYEETLSEITTHLQEQSDLRMILQQTMSDFGKVLGASQARVRLQITPSEFDISKLFQPKE
ncbi:MAG: GAF domain-containing protein [Anaerolineae bacterium]|nr:GAF domain-containing protein [Anaerolineae bacterium]